jgi:hypothetical protein
VGLPSTGSGQGRAAYWNGALKALSTRSVPLTYVTTYGTTWRNPNSILDARFAKISAQIDF